MKYKTLVDPELKRLAIRIPFSKALIYGDKLTHRFYARLTVIPPAVSKRTLLIRGKDGSSFPADLYEPRNRREKLPALILIHGGAFSFRAAPYHIQLAAEYAVRAGCRVFFPDYRILPKDPWPAAWQDSLAMYRHVMENAETYGIDTERIGVAGDSAGGLLAALLSLKYEEEALIKPCLQMLVYPMTDYDTNLGSMKKYKDAPIWSLKNHRIVVPYYFRNLSEEEIRDVLPMRQKLPEQIPDAYVETTEFDILHDEGILYAKKLQDARASVVINDTSGTFHGYDLLPHTQIARRNIEQRIRFLNDAFNHSAAEEKR